MKFVLIAIIFTTLHYESSQYDVYSQLFRPYSSYRYVRTQRTMPTMPTTMPTMSTMPTMRSTLSTMRPTMPTMRPTMLTTRPTMSTVSTTMFRYAQPPTIRYGVYRNFTPENRGLVVLKKETDANQMQSHLDNLLSRMKSTMMQMSHSQGKPTDDPNGEHYKGKRTRKTTASFRSASV